MKKLVKDLIDNLVSTGCQSTRDITSQIKLFLSQRYNDKNGLRVCYSSNPKEYLLDAIVTNFSPTNLVEENNAILSIIPSNPEVLLAVESELGGSGGGSQKTLQQNVLEDFLKLLITKSRRKLMIFTSLEYHNENNSLGSRIGNLYDIYEKSPSFGEHIVLIHIEGRKIRNQVSILPLREKSFTVYEFCNNGYDHIDI